MAIFACIRQAAGIDLGRLFLVMGLLIGGAVSLQSSQSSGTSNGILERLQAISLHFGEITVTSTGKEYSTLAGNLAAILTGLIVTTTISLIKPQNFDREITRAINSKTVEVLAVEPQSQQDSERGTPADASDSEKKQHEEGNITPPREPLPPVAPKDDEAQRDVELEEHSSKLRRAFVAACLASFIVAFCMDFLLPILMFFSHYVFNRGFLTAWILVTFISVFASKGISVILPIVQARDSFKQFAKSIIEDSRRK